MGEADERIGSLVDERYKVLEPMASGSMGSVYKAERVPVGKLVAIKFLKASFANDSEFLGRFERETRVMSKLAHPNCVSVVDFGVFDGAPYLVMEYVSGTTLRAIIDRDVALAVPRALLIARQLASGLAHAHAQGIVHRDIKPANIMITDEIGTGEHVRILDFGLARLRGGNGNFPGRDATQTNMVVGTPNYMAPEQTVPGGMIDLRTDIYAVGVVLYEMIVGKRPFQAEDTMALLGMHRAAPIPRLEDVLSTGFDVPDGLQDVIDTAMAKAPSDRYQSAIELKNAIDELAATPQPIIHSGSSSIVRFDGDHTKVDKPVKPVKKTGGQRQVAKHPTAAVAETVQLDLDSAVVVRERPSRVRFVFGALLLVGGIAAGAVYLIKRGEQESNDMLARASGAVETGSSTETGSAAPPPIAIDAAQPSGIAETGSGSAVVETGSATGSGSGSASASAADAGSGSAAETGSGTAIAAADTGSGSGSGEEIEMDPVAAVDPDPDGAGSGSATPKEEAADAPQRREEVEAKLPPALPALATTVTDVVQLIKLGKRELALASLRPLDRKNPRSAYIPFLMGNLYFDKLWWGIAMDEYARAIQKNAGYKGNATLNRNLITMLGSGKTSWRAMSMLRSNGKHATPYLRTNRDENPNVRRAVSALLRGR